MTESGEKGFGKLFQRKVIRTKEKMMESFGKADRTTDSTFDQLAIAFTEQQNVANHLLKEFKNFASQVKAMSAASHSLYQLLSETYEASWPGVEDFLMTNEQLVGLWDDYYSKLSDNIQNNINAYANRFPDVKNKVAKRGRKLIDYDVARHNLESLENAKKRDEFKVVKATEDLATAKSVYDSINSELCDELPALYNSRVPTLAHSFATFFNNEAHFAEESSKIKHRMAELAEELANKSPLGSPANNLQIRYSAAADVKTEVKFEESYRRVQSDDRIAVDLLVSVSDNEERDNKTKSYTSSSNSVNRADSYQSPAVDSVFQMPQSPQVKANGSGGGDMERFNSTASTDRDDDLEDVFKLEVNSGLVDNVPNGKFLYKVITTHPYTAVDDDEISFEAGEIIDVLPTAQDDEDEGWSMGIKRSNGKRGVFPINFTRKLED